MRDLRLYVVTNSQPHRVHLPEKPRSLHDLPDNLPYGVYTVFRTFEHNKFLRLSDHLDRVQQSIALMPWQYHLHRQRLRRALHQVCTAYPGSNSRIRLDVLREAAEQLGGKSRVLLTLAPFVPVPDVYYEEGVRVGLAPDLRRSQPRAKTADFVFARRRYPVDPPDVFDYLLLDSEGQLLEGSTSNFYAVRADSVWTAAKGVLEGITRKIVLELIAEAEIPLHLQAVPLAEIDELDEAFLSSSSRGLVPIVEIEGHQIGSGRPGPRTRQLMDAYDEFVARAIRPAIAPQAGEPITPEDDGGSGNFW